MIVGTNNEWGRLRSVVVGRAENARVPVNDLSLRAICAGGGKQELKHGPFPKRVIDEATEDLDGLCRVFEQAGVVVYRPRIPDTETMFGVSGWKTDASHAY